MPKKPCSKTDQSHPKPFSYLLTKPVEHPQLALTEIPLGIHPEDILEVKARAKSLDLNDPAVARQVECAAVVYLLTFLERSYPWTSVAADMMEWRN